MSNVTLVKAGIDPAHNDDKSLATTDLSHDTGSIVSSSGMTMNTVSEKVPIFQKMPQNTLSDFMNRETEILDFTISNTDSGLDIVQGFDPWVLYLSNTRVADKVSTYKYIRGTIELAFVIAVPGNAFGSYVISALPQGGPSPAATNEFQLSPNLSPPNCMQVDHFARVDIASCENVVMQLPFLWPYDYADLATKVAGSWKVFVTCLAPIQTAIPGGVSSGSVKVFARLMEDYELVVPHLQGRQHQQPAHQKPSSMTQKFLKAKDTHAVSSVASKVSDVADKLSSVPVIGPYAAAASKAAKAVGKVASFFGFTREDAEHAPTAFAIRPFTSQSHFDGDDIASKATFSLANAISIDPTMHGGTSTDEASFASLFNRWTLVKAMSWGSAAATGSTLGSLPITPSYCYNVDDQLFPTTAGFVGAPFQFWRGDMEYLIVIPVSKLHRGSLQIAWIPTGSTLATTITNATLNIIYDVSTGDEKQFVVGYARDRPMAVNNFMTDSTIQNYDWTNGRLAFRVINPLSCQNASPEVNVLVFARASSNMRFAVPRTKGFFPSVTPATSLMEVAYTLQGASGDEDDHQPEVVELVPASGDYPMDQLLFGESFDSVRPLMQKPFRLYPKSDSDTRQFWTLPPFGYLAGMGDTSEVSQFVPTFTYLSWYRTLFCCIAGSERFKIIPRYCLENEVCGVERVFNRDTGAYNGYANYNDAVPGTLVPLYPCASGRGYEGTVPYYQIRRFIKGHVTFLANDDDSSRLEVAITRIWHMQYSGTMDIAPNIWHSAGPDLRLSHFRQVPTVIANTEWSSWPTVRALVV